MIPTKDLIPLVKFWKTGKKFTLNFFPFSSIFDFLERCWAIINQKLAENEFSKVLQKSPSTGKYCLFSVHIT